MAHDTVDGLQPTGTRPGPAARWTRVFRREFGACAEQVADARHWLAGLLPVDHPCRDAGIEVISELVTNAVLHGSPDADATVWASVRLLPGRWVHLVVTDTGRPDRDCPTIQNPDRDVLSGRGLAIVARLAASLSWTRHGTGHKVNALLDPATHPEPAEDPDLDGYLAIDDQLDHT